jgi:ArsR family transcriptional regulator
MTRVSEDEAQLIAKALGDPRRYEILRKIGESEGAFSCESMRGCMEISPATLSHHMKELEGAGLVDVERKGKFAYYTLRRDVLEGFFGRLKKDLV